MPHVSYDFKDYGSLDRIKFFFFISLMYCIFVCDGLCPVIAKDSLSMSQCPEQLFVACFKI